MCTTCDQLFVVFVQDGHVQTIFRTETMIMQSRLFPNLVGKSLLHYTEERARVTTRVGPVNVWVFGGIPFPRETGMMLRSCKVAMVAVIGPLTILHLGFFLIPAAAAAHARATSIFSCLCSISSLCGSSQVRSWSSGNQIPGSPSSKVEV